MHLFKKKEETKTCRLLCINIHFKCFSARRPGTPTAILILILLLYLFLLPLPPFSSWLLLLFFLLQLFPVATYISQFNFHRQPHGWSSPRARLLTPNLRGTHW